MSQRQTISAGTIVSYDPGSATGRIRLRVSSRLVKFSLTCFDAGRAVRPPNKGEAVAVIFVDGYKDPLAVVSASLMRKFRSADIDPEETCYALATIQQHTPYGGWLQCWQGDGDGPWHAAIEAAEGRQGTFIRGSDGDPLWGSGETMEAALVALATDCRERHILDGITERPT